MFSCHANVLFLFSQREYKFPGGDVGVLWSCCPCCYDNGAGVLLEEILWSEACGVDLFI